MDSDRTERICCVSENRFILWIVWRGVIMNQNQSWYAHVDELLAYLRENGKYPPSDSLLGYWVSHQRYAYHHGKLSKERQAFLELIGFK